MKSNMIFYLAFMVLTFNCNGQNEKKDSNNSSLVIHVIESKIDHLVDQYLELDIFSGVILVSEKGNPLYHKAFGMANREKGTKNTLLTKFDIGSMNKTFTKVIVLKLLEEGKLGLDDKLGKYLDDIDPIAAEKATINDLLHHSSGYGDYLTHEYDALPSHHKDFKNTLSMVKSMPLEFEPGTDQIYSNIGYILLGGIIEVITRRSYFENVQDIILGPLNMTETSMVPKRQVENLANGYYRAVDGTLMTNENFIEYPKPDGGFRSTPMDIVKFYNDYHYGNIILKDDTKLQDDFFIAIQQHADSGAAIPHAGGYPGANTVKYEVLRDKISIMVFANMNEPVAEQLGAGILAIIRNQNPMPPSFPAIPNIYKHYEKYGLDYIQENFESLTKNFHASDPKGIILNSVGYYYLNDRKSINDAISIFKLNTRLFGEQDPNTWDSLGEAYYRNGQINEALSSYRKALSIDPEFVPSLEMVRKIESEN